MDVVGWISADAADARAGGGVSSLLPPSSAQV